jgi:hypothetical protein
VLAAGKRLNGSQVAVVAIEHTCDCREGSPQGFAARAGGGQLRVVDEMLHLQFPEGAALSF